MAPSSRMWGAPSPAPEAAGPCRRLDPRQIGKRTTVQPSLRTRVRWRLEELRHPADAKLIVGVIAVAALSLGGFLVARATTRASAGSAAVTREVTLRQKVRVHEHGRLVTRWRVRRLYSQAQTVLRTQTISTPNGIRVVTRPVTRYRRIYRDRPAAPARTVTVIRPGAAAPVTVSNSVTVTQPVTVVETTTAVSTVTDTLPITVTVP